MLTQHRLKQVLSYNPDTGVFTRNITVSSRAKKGDIAGCNHSGGYKVITIDGYKLYCHHLAWLYTYGEWPKYIDHINGIPSDNRISNLRKASHGQNMQNRKIHKNNKSGYKGVYWHKQCQKWCANIRLNGKHIHLGLYESAEEAHQVYLNKAEELFGEFSSSG